jgi:hypothetical protein
MRCRLVSAVLVLVVGVLPGCFDGTDPSPVLDGTMHATIANRTTQNPTFVGSSDPWDAEKALTATMTPGGNLVIAGVENSGIAITLTVYDAAVGSFSALGGEPAPRLEATFGNDRTFTYTSAAFGGTISATITELTATKAVGTFEFLAFPVIADGARTPSYRIRNGTFDVTIR